MCFGVGKSYTNMARRSVHWHSCCASAFQSPCDCVLVFACNLALSIYPYNRCVFQRNEHSLVEVFPTDFLRKEKIDNCLLLDEASSNDVLKWKFTCFLTLSSLSQNVDHKFKYHSKKGQLPFIELNGQQIGDSTTIIKELSQKFEKDIDAGLTKEQKNISHAMISMVENHLTFVILSWRAKNPKEMINGYKINFQQSLGSKIPNAILSFVFRFNYGHRVSDNTSSIIRRIIQWRFQLKF